MEGITTIAHFLITFANAVRSTVCAHPELFLTAGLSLVVVTIAQWWLHRLAWRRERTKLILEKAALGMSIASRLIEDPNSPGHYELYGLIKSYFPYLDRLAVRMHVAKLELDGNEERFERMQKDQDRTYTASQEEAIAENCRLSRTLYQEYLRVVEKQLVYECERKTLSLRGWLYNQKRWKDKDAPKTIKSIHQLSE